MQKKIISILVLSLVSFSILAEVQEKDYTIITDPREVKLIFEQCSRMTPTFRTGYRELDEATVDKIEQMLPQALTKAANDKPFDMSDYKRQYGAFEILRRELVYVNGFHKEAVKQWAAGNSVREAALDNWESSIINVCGGEMNYWGVLYDAQSDAIVEVLFNNKRKQK